jgi:hypothetical protein
MHQTFALALITESAKAEKALAPSARHHLRHRLGDNLVLRLLIGLSSMERAFTPTAQASPLLRRLS